MFKSILTSLLLFVSVNLFAQDYATDYHKVLNSSSKWMIVISDSDRCHWCQKLDAVITQLDTSGTTVTKLNPNDPYAMQLVQLHELGGGIPQVYIYEAKDRKFFLLRKFAGFKTQQEIQSFLDE